MSEILSLQPGAHIGIIAGTTFQFGKITSVTANQVCVEQAGGVVRKFSRVSLFEIGHKGTRYTCPALVSHGEAVRRQREYAEATRLAGERLRKAGVL
jgi:hypothetical protein